MAITRFVANAPAAIKAKLSRVPGTNNLYSHSDLPGILLREIPAGSLTQYGGFVNIQRSATGVRTIGAAGAWLSKFPSQSNPGACLNVTYSSSVAGSGNLKGSGAVTADMQVNPGYTLTGNRPSTAQLLAVIPSGLGQTSASAMGGISSEFTWVAANVLDELLLGWVCPVQSGIIWEGDVMLDTIGRDSSDYITSTVRGQCSVTMACVVDMPLNIDWSQVDFVGMKAQYIAGCSPDVVEYVKKAWDQCLPDLKAVKQISQPFPVCLSSKGLELSPSFARYLVPSGYAKFAFAPPNLIGPWVSAPVTSNWPAGTGSPVALAYGGTVRRMPGASANGLVLPRLVFPRISNIAGGAQVLYDAFYYSANPEFVSINGSYPQSITGLPAAPLLGPIFPLVYAGDTMMHSAGNLTLSSIINILGDNTGSLINPTISSVAGDGSTTQGDASIVNEGQAFNTLETSLMSWNYGVDVTMKTFVQSVRQRTEQLARADKSTFGF